MRYKTVKPCDIKSGDVWTLNTPPAKGPYVINVALSVRGNKLRCLRIEYDGQAKIWTVDRTKYKGYTLHLMNATKDGFEFIAE